MHFQLLETENLLLRKITPEVYHFLFNSQSDEEIKSFLGLETDEQLTKEKDKFSKGMTTYNRSFVNFQILDKKTNEILGACGYHTWFPDHARAEIGYALNNDIHKGKGIMSEALKPIIHFGFTEMNLNRIEALVGTANIASQKLINKLNFKQEGILRQHYCNQGILENSVLFSLLKEEYETSSV